MKKIMMIIAAFAITGSLSAASVNWTFSATGTGFGDYDIYLTSVGSGFESVADIEKAMIGTGASGTTVAGSRTSSAAGTITGLTAEKTYDFFYVAVKDNKYWVSSAQKVTTGAESAGAAATTFAAANGKTLLSGAATGTLAVPEPTSGLLLLLGMAGLALKRKVA